jgi:hypothetical protein
VDPKLDACPFCGGPAEFVRKKDGQLLVAHYPASGVVCPARWEAVIDTPEQGAAWWNRRFLGSFGAKLS